MKANEFERLVTVANQKRWCWNIGCTTCGNMQIRNSLELIGMGQLPEELDEADLTSITLFRDKAEYDRDIRLSRELVKTDLQAFSGLLPRNWLGCMGLALLRFERFPIEPAMQSVKERRKACWLMISSSWAEQFSDLLRNDADPEVVILLQKCKKGQSLMTWQDLTPIEKALAASGCRQQVA